MTTSAPARWPLVRTFGDGAIDALPGIVHRLGHRRILLVCGERSFEASGAARILPRFHDDAEVVRWSGFAPNTDVADLRRGLEIAQDLGPEAVLGIGGGSALDMAKLITAYQDIPPETVTDEIRAGRTVSTRRCGLLLTPTTSGSGSEATHFAVVYVDEVKHSVGGPALRADHVVIDPSLTLSGSPYQRATSGIDAVAQAIESLWATGATPWSRRFAWGALHRLLPVIETFVRHPDRSSARAMAIGAHLAGRAIDISKTTAPHALSYGITKSYGPSHGHAVALTLGAFVAEHARATPERLRSGVDPGEHRRNMADILEILGARNADEAHHRVDDLVARLGLRVGLAANGITTLQQRAALAAEVNVERLGNNPIHLDVSELERILERCA